MRNRITAQDAETLIALKLRASNTQIPLAEGGTLKATTPQGQILTIVSLLPQEGCQAKFALPDFQDSNHRFIVCTEQDETGTPVQWVFPEMCFTYRGVTRENGTAEVDLDLPGEEPWRGARRKVNGTGWPATSHEALIRDQRRLVGGDGIPSSSSTTGIGSTCLLRATWVRRSTGVRRTGGWTWKTYSEISARWCNGSRPGARSPSQRNPPLLRRGSPPSHPSHSPRTIPDRAARETPGAVQRSSRRLITAVFGVIVYAIRFKTPSLHR